MAPTFTFVVRTFTMSLSIENLFVGVVSDSTEAIFVPLYHWSIVLLFHCSHRT